MGFIELDADDVVEAVKGWSPGPCFSEARCQVSLLRYLQAKFPRSIFSIEHRIGDGRADIYAELRTRLGPGAKVIIELKYNLSDRNEYLRLLGQLQEYVGMSTAEVVVVLCGETKREWADQILARLSKLVESRWFYKAFVITKSISARGTNGRFLPAQAQP